MNKRTILSLVLTGAWLGVSQVALGFHLLYGQGANVMFYFCLVNVWLAGSIIGLILSSRINELSKLLRCACIIVFAIAAYLSRSDSSSFLPASMVYLCAALTGCFAGWFLWNQVKSTQMTARVLFHENNGFIAGYAMAGTILFFSVTGLDFLSVALGALSLLNSLPANPADSHNPDNLNQSPPGHSA